MTTIDNRSTPEELEKSALEIANDENAELNPPVPSEEQLQDEPETPVEPIDPPEEPEKEEDEDLEDPKPEEPKPSPAPEPEKKADEPDYKEKYSASSREAQILASRLKATNEAAEAAASLPEPTDDEMKKEYPDWDVLSEFEKKQAKKTTRAEQGMQLMAQAATQNKKFDSWNTDVTGFLDSPETIVKYPELDGREEAFKSFCLKPTRMGVEFEDLVSSFLFSADKETKEKGTKHKGALLLTGTGANKAPKPKMSTEDISNLRKTNPKEYNRQVQAGKIEIAI